ncbi:hypothetical protein CI109_107084 [Kwoniella shandongensis]|uniref:Uncharacterized protein n=1 Tax=Kwoniella shandongensis TaxID=1734106 RepID=A0A5M6BR24_9TREE|nr:uncharacterized protein CI109_006492 [Kwoniella shandongensis]KAA5525223.1 hypothetical protein CI109_006492 [Kwoniella shandongensis]
MASTDEIVTRLFSRPTPPPLEPGTKVYAPELTPAIAKLKEHKFVIAALHLANDDIHHCHLIAQDNEGDSTADLLHATLHRREGDYWNSKYWWSHVGSHPTVSISEAKLFVDNCEKISKTKGDDIKLRERQWKELKALVEWTRTNCH